ncbi:MAG: multidrug effflux MFS transporter, partial [Endomicrobium sp.]|nr:multidrug effflux MFS transporter [Endomicrobium sp.]
MENSKKQRNSAFFLFVLLGMLTAFGPFVTDMYLPSLPAMMDYFSTSASMVQLGLTFSMLGLAAGQIIFGPLSDKYGRKKPLLISMFLFLVSTVSCIFAPSIEIFVLLRFVQGIAGAGGIVISRSIATDKFKGRNLATALAIIGAINGIAPVIAPVTGGAVLRITSWHGVFVVLFFAGIALTAGCLYFNESLSIMRRSKEKLSKTLSLFKFVLKNRKFVSCVLQMAFAQAILFGYISSSPFIIQQHYGFSPFAFSLFFGINSVAIVSGAAIAVKFKRQETGIYTSCIGMLICGALELIALSNGASIILYEALILIL